MLRVALSNINVQELAQQYSATLPKKDILLDMPLLYNLM
jgi:hypothetical protein